MTPVLYIEVMNLRRICQIAIAAALAFSVVAVADSVVSVRSVAALYGTSTPVAGRYIVVVKGQRDVDALATELASDGLKVVRKYKLAVRGVAVDLSSDQVTRLRSNGRVVYLEKSRKIKITESSWGIDRIDQRTLPLNSRIERGVTGAGVTAYVVDTGIAAGHNEFSGRVRNGYSVFGSTADCNGHGTHVAGTIGGDSIGVATAVNLVPVRVLDCNGSGTIEGVIEGLNWMIRHHKEGEPAVANLSLGAGMSQALNDAVEAAVRAGITVVVAAGNSDEDACNTSPASEPSAITVGATTIFDTRASYSNFGPCLDLFGPGSDIVSAANNGQDSYQTLSGTSMASPHVAGVAALYLGVNPDATPSEVRDSLVEGSSRNVVRNANGSPNVLVSTLAITNPDAPSPSSPPPDQTTTTTASPWRPTTTVPEELAPPRVELSINGRDVVVDVSSGERYGSYQKVEISRGYSRLVTKYSSSVNYIDEDRATSYGTVTYTVKASDYRGRSASTSASIRVNPPSPPRVDEGDIYVYKDGYRYTAVVPFNTYYSGDTVALYCGYSEKLIASASGRTGKIVVTSLTSNLYYCRLWGLSDSGAAKDYNTFDLRRY